MAVITRQQLLAGCHLPLHSCCCCATHTAPSLCYLPCLSLQVMKDRCAALQCQLERMREQLVAAEGDNTSLRADLAGLLGARQEANAAREKLRQVQLDSSRRITELEADAADMSQQIMVSGCVLLFVLELAIADGNMEAARDSSAGGQGASCAVC
jgi:hypothetical protein